MNPKGARCFRKRVEQRRSERDHGEPPQATPSSFFLRCKRRASLPSEGAPREQQL